MAVGVVRLRGPFVDAYVYRTQLFVLTYNGELRVFPIGQIEAIVDSIGSVGQRLSYSLFHSRGRGSSEEQRFARDTADSSDKDLAIEVTDLEYSSEDLKVEGVRVTDFKIYLDTLFIASDSGLWTSPLSNGLPMAAERPLRSACYSVSAGWGAVAAARGTKGLSVLYDYLAGGASRREYRREDIGVRSVRTAFAGHALVTYDSRNSFEFLEGEVAELHDRPGATQQRLTKVERETTTGSTRSDRSGLRKLDSALDLVANVGSQFIGLSAGTIYTSRTQGGTSRRMSKLVRVGDYSGKALGVNLLAGAPLVETQSSVTLGGGKARQAVLYEGPAVSVRTYPNSIRYQNLATIVTDDGLLLAGNF